MSNSVLRLKTLIMMSGTFLRTLGRGIIHPHSLSKKPIPDPDFPNAFFPSPLSLGLYVPPQTDYTGPNNPQTASLGAKILTILTDESYLGLKNGTFFSTGNHPVEMLLPLMHLKSAGFEIEIATITGNPAKLENWALPRKDKKVLAALNQLQPQLNQPKKLAEIISAISEKKTDYRAIFIPGGHGAVLGLPKSSEVALILNWAMDNNRYIISLCHGPAALLSTAQNGQESIFSGFEVCVFPTELDAKQNVRLGYLPGEMIWFVGDELEKIGVKVINKGIIGQVHKDRNLLTGDSPLASNNLGKLAVKTLLSNG